MRGQGDGHGASDHGEQTGQPTKLITGMHSHLQDFNSTLSEPARLPSELALGLGFSLSSERLERGVLVFWKGFCRGGCV